MFKRIINWVRAYYATPMSLGNLTAFEAIDVEVRSNDR